MTDHQQNQVEDERQQREAESRVATVLADKWRLESLRGVGGMAAVYSAIHKNGRRAAIKVLHSDFRGNVEAKERFLAEAYAVNRVNHPGAVLVLDDGETPDGCAFLVMDLLEGETVEDIWRREGYVLPPLAVLTFLDTLLDVIDAAHAQGVIHRDIKPENVFVTKEGAVKLFDFGIAHVDESRPSRNGGRTHKTQLGVTMGTPAYMPPEQARGRWEELDASSDLWAVGATAFALLTGRTVHHADTVNEVLLSAMTQPAPPVKTFAPDLTERTARVIDQALSFDKQGRYHCAVEMQGDVRDARAELLAMSRGDDGPSGLWGPDGQLRSSGPPRSTYSPVSASRSVSSTLPPAQKKFGIGLAAVALGGAVAASFVLFQQLEESWLSAASAALARPVHDAVAQADQDVAVPADESVGSREEETRTAKDGSERETEPEAERTDHQAGHRKAQPAERSSNNGSSTNAHQATPVEDLPSVQERQKKARLAAQRRRVRMAAEIRREISARETTQPSADAGVTQGNDTTDAGRGATGEETSAGQDAPGGATSRDQQRTEQEKDFDPLRRRR